MTKRSPFRYQDAFVLHSEILELKTKPSALTGERGQDAFGRQATFDDRGTRLRALLNTGNEDLEIGGLTPFDPQVSLLL